MYNIVTGRDCGSGIYKITNRINGKVYIGQSVNLTNRMVQHFDMLTNNRHTNRPLQNAFNKYGRDAFAFEIIEYCDVKDLDEREVYYIKQYDALDKRKGYNLRAGGNQPVLSFYSRLRISRTMTKNWRDIEKRKQQSIKTSTITTQQVRYIKMLLYMDMHDEDIADLLGVSRAIVRHIQYLESHVYVLSEFNSYIKNRYKINKKKKRCEESLRKTKEK